MLLHMLQLAGCSAIIIIPSIIPWSETYILNVRSDLPLLQYTMVKSKDHRVAVALFLYRSELHM